MKAPATFAVGLWVLIVGANIIQPQLMPLQVFMNAPRLPWPIVFMPLIVVVGGAFFSRGYPGEAGLGGWVDGRFGQGTYREFMDILRPELMFAAMCLGIVLSTLAREFLFNTIIMPPEILGLFACGSGAFVAAYLIRRRRERA